MASVLLLFQDVRLGKFHRQKTPIREWNQSGMQLQQKEFQHTIKEREKKANPATRIVLRNATVASLGCFPVLHREFCYLLSLVNVI